MTRCPAVAVAIARRRPRAALVGYHNEIHILPFLNVHTYFNILTGKIAEAALCVLVPEFKSQTTTTTTNENSSNKNNEEMCTVGYDTY